MKKSQIAMEFLMTYGWAILASMVAIGALAYFGITNPARSIPDKCIISNDLFCSEYILISPDVMKVRIVNGVGQTIYSPAGTAFTPQGNSVICTIDGGDWPSNDVREMNCTLTGATLSKNTKTKIKFDLTYLKIASTGYPQRAPGELYATVQ